MILRQILEQNQWAVGRIPVGLVKIKKKKKTGQLAIFYFGIWKPELRKW